MSTVVYYKGSFYSDSKITILEQSSMSVRQALELAEKACRNEEQSKFIRGALKAKTTDEGALAYGGKWIVPEGDVYYRGGKVKAVANVGNANNFYAIDALSHVEGDFEEYLKEQMSQCISVVEYSHLMVATDIGVYIVDRLGEAVKFIDYDDEDCYAIGSGAWEFYDNAYAYYTDKTLELGEKRHDYLWCRVSNTTPEVIISAASKWDEFTNNDIRKLEFL